MIITILRKPLEGTVADNVLKHGCGAININSCRIDSGSEVITTHSQSRKSAHEDKSIYGQFKGDMETHQTKGQEIGRWPANFILTHFEGCEIRGTKKVKSDGNHTYKTPQDGGTIKLGLKNLPSKGNPYADADGKEEVLDWDCVEGCPVQELDGDEGGTSRFFKQFKEDNQ